MKKEYIYLGKLEYAFGGALFTEDNVEITDKKIGKTKVCPRGRSKGINVNSPILYKNVAVWEVDNCDEVESQLHTIFKDARVHLDDGTRTEFFKDENGNMFDSINTVLTMTGKGILSDKSASTPVTVTPTEADHLSRMDDETKDFYLNLKGSLSILPGYTGVRCTQSYISFLGPKKAFLTIKPHKSKKVRDTNGGYKLDMWNHESHHEEYFAKFGSALAKHTGDTWTNNNYVIWCNQNTFDVAFDLGKTSLELQQLNQ